MAKRNPIDWTVMKGDELKCLRCGAVYKLHLPIDVLEFCEKLKGFNLLHKTCQEKQVKP
jgi:hypothetical protein